MQNFVSRITTVLILGSVSAMAAIQPIPVPVPDPPKVGPIVGVVKPAPALVLSAKTAKLIAPDELSAIYEIGFGAADSQANDVTRRLSDLRAARFTLDTPVAGKGPGHKGVIEADGKTTADYKGNQVLTHDSRWGGFLSGSATRIDVEDEPSADGYGITAKDITSGIDYRVTDKLTLGVLIGYSHAGADLHHGDISSDTGTLGVYGSWVDGGFYVNGLVSGSYSSYDIRRGALGGHARGETDGFGFSSLISTGYDFQNGQWTYGPFVDLQYSRVQYDGYREHGSTFPLEIEDNDSDSLSSRLGARVARTFLIGSMGVRPELAVAWQHEYLDESRPTDAHLTSGSHAGFRSEGPRTGRDALVVNASVAFLHNERWSSYVGYDAVLGRDNYEAQTVSAGVRLKF